MRKIGLWIISTTINHLQKQNTTKPWHHLWSDGNLKSLKAKYFPMPDYDFGTYNQVGVKIYGKTLDDKYTFILYDNPD